MSTLEILTRQLVDYAGLFPPANLPMEQVVANFATYLNRADSGMLARLIIPVARLAEFETAAADLLPKKQGLQPWRISGLIPSVDAPNEAFKFAMSGIEQFNERHRIPENGLAVVDVVEVKAPSRDLIIETAEQMPVELKAFMEIPHDQPPAELISTIGDQNSAAGGLRFFAKIRTGGVTPELIPPIEQVAGFIFDCAEHFLGFKATAGLHHPVRNEHQLTYEPNAPKGTMHGFLNVFVATCFAFSGANRETIIEILSSGNPELFRFDDHGLYFGEHTVSATRIKAIRNQFAISFGSCSFDEPSQELDALNLTNAVSQ